MLMVPASNEPADTLKRTASIAADLFIQPAEVVEESGI
jgi:hypothetical protein